MPATEAQLKQQLRDNALSRIYVLFGEESYLTAHYVRKLADKAVGGEELADFNRIELDGQECGIDAVIDAAESLPLMAERKCVLVRELDAASAAVHDRLLDLLRDPPDSCVLILWYAHPLDTRKSAKWKAFLAAAEKVGTCVEFFRRTQNEIAKLLSSGAARRGCTLSPDTARGMVEQCGDDMQLLLNELDKLCAVVGEGGEITPALVERVATRQLSARVYDLSKAILKGDYTDSYAILHRLFAAREEPISVLAVLSGAYVDLYRAKTAIIAGVAPETLAAEFGYRGREFVLRNAAHDCRKLELSTLRQCLELLAAADLRMKGSRVQPRVVLEQTVAQLIVLGKGGRL